MKSSFFIVADRGNFKVFRVEKTATENHPRLHLLQATTLAEGHAKIGDINTDAEGNAPGVPNSTGEKHYDLELDRRAARQLAQMVEEVLQKEKPAAWSFAAPKGMNSAILSHVRPEWQRTLAENLPQDLTNVAHNTLLGHFSEVRAA